VRINQSAVLQRGLQPTIVNDITDERKLRFWMNRSLKRTTVMQHTLCRYFLNQLLKNFPTVVSHLVVVVGLCTDDPKDF